MRPALAAALLLLGGGLAGGASAQQRPPPPGLPPGLPTGVPPLACGPGDPSPACEAIRRAAPGGAIPGLVAPRLAAPPPSLAPRGNGATPPRPGRFDYDDAPPRRFVPPQVLGLLAHPRIEPLTRAYLTGMAGRPLEEWTLADLQMLGGVVPVLVEVGVPADRLRDLYQALGLDPGSLFEPQLGDGWQGSSTEFDQRNLRLRRGACPGLQRLARADPAAVRVQELLTCAETR